MLSTGVILSTGLSTLIAPLSASAAVTTTNSSQVTIKASNATASQTYFAQDISGGGVLKKSYDWYFDQEIPAIPLSVRSTVSGILGAISFTGIPQKILASSISYYGLNYFSKKHVLRVYVKNPNVVVDYRMIK
jgi:hypothetical protein